jgi:AcrR family transcriptional regulator
MAEVDRDAIVDNALELFTNQGYNATTLADIASASDLQPDIVAAAFPAKVSFIFTVVDDMFAAVFEELAKIPQTEELVDALRAAHQNAVERIIAGEGPVPLIRMHRMGRVIATNPAVAQSVSVHRKQVLAHGLADRRGVDHDDPQIKKAVTVWSAIMASTHAAAAHDEDEPDRFATNLTIQRLNRTFNLVRGNASPDTAADGLRPRSDG